MQTQRGFTLLELAIGLVVLGLAVVGALVSLTALTENRKIAETRGMLLETRDSLMAFATTQGRLPCPATLVSNGQESILSNVAGVITCTSEQGFVPSVTLGLSGLNELGLKNDAWDDGTGGGSPRSLRYAISSLAAPVANALTSPGLGAPTSSTRRVDVQTSITGNQGLFVCQSSTGLAGAGNRCGSIANTLSANAAFVVWSLGADAREVGTFSADEQQNANWTVQRVLVSRTYAPIGSNDGRFDDIVVWQPYSLVAERLFAGGFVQ